MATWLLVSSLTFLAIFGGALAGVWLSGRLPEHHLGTESRTAVSVSMAVVGTMAALVLSLLITNASAAFNAQVRAIDGLATDIVKLDRALVRYGDETVGIRQDLRAYAASKAQDITGQGDRSGSGADTLRLLEHVGEGILALRPASPRNQQIQQRTLALVDAITDARWALAETEGSAIPLTFLLILIFWLALLFASFGLFAPRNGTVLASLLLCALAISGGVFVILELGTPNSGLIRISVAPIDFAIRQISVPGR